MKEVKSLVCNLRVNDVDEFGDSNVITQQVASDSQDLVGEHSAESTARSNDSTIFRTNKFQTEKDKKRKTYSE